MTLVLNLVVSAVFALNVYEYAVHGDPISLAAAAFLGYLVVADLKLRR